MFCGFVSPLLAAWFLLWLAATLRPAAPPKKRQGSGRTLQRPHPCRFFGGQQVAAHPPPNRYPLWLGARCLVPAMARCVNAPSCSPKQRKGDWCSSASGRSPVPLPLFGGQDGASPLPHPAAAEGAGWCSSARRPFTSLPLPPPLPVQPPKGGLPF